MTLNLFLFIALIFLSTYLLGHLLEKIRIPWIFAALVLGSALAIKNPVTYLTTSETFTFLAQLGMYFLLFLVGVKLDLSSLKKEGKFVLGSTFFIIFLEALLGSLVIHFVFNYGWITALLVSLSFATVGEAILIPILDEFGIVNTTLGQAIIGIGTTDDILELAALIMATIVVGAKSNANIWIILGALTVLFVMAFALKKLHSEAKQFKFVNIETQYLLFLFVFFIFLGVGVYADAAPLAAIMAGVALRLFLPASRFKQIEKEIDSITYGFFAPLFFFWIGTELNFSYLITYPLLILLVVAVSNLAKIVGSWIAGHKKLGTKGSILLGIGLSVRFSSSIIIIKFLFDNGVVDGTVYSVIVASSIVFKFLVPLLFSQLLVRWGFAKSQA